MRFTKKIDLEEFGYDYVLLDETNQPSANYKLGQLEDAEEENEIDLVTLFKALKDGAWFKNPYYLSEINYIKNLEFNIDFNKKRFDIRMDCFVKFYDYSTGGAFFLFKDYGKTWALTKEELL
jgi:hypothetical protein